MGTIYQRITQAYRWLKKPSHLLRGHIAERRAETFLRKEGLIVIARNYACRWGEIDLIAISSDTLVFVEVRLRQVGCAFDSVDTTKQQKIIRTADHYLALHPAYADRPCRFDVIGMQHHRSGDISWLKHAF